jgi:hypothetical protein
MRASYFQSNQAELVLNNSEIRRSRTNFITGHLVVYDPQQKGIINHSGYLRLYTQLTPIIKSPYLYTKPQGSSIIQADLFDLVIPLELQVTLERNGRIQGQCPLTDCIIEVRRGTHSQALPHIKKPRRKS